MEAQDRANEKPASETGDDRPFESDGQTYRTTETGNQEHGQFNPQDRNEDAVGAVHEAAVQTEFENPDHGQLDLQDRQDELFESSDRSDEPADSDETEEPHVETEDRTDRQADAGDVEEAPLESENRVFEQLDHLISEIDRAVGIIRQLRQQNAELNERNRELQERLENKGQAISGLREERERLRSIYDDNASLIENKEEIQRKIETMISRLDSVNTA